MNECMQKAFLILQIMPKSALYLYKFQKLINFQDLMKAFIKHSLQLFAAMEF